MRSSRPHLPCMRVFNTTTGEASQCRGFRWNKMLSLLSVQSTMPSPPTSVHIAHRASGGVSWALAAVAVVAGDSTFCSPTTRGSFRSLLLFSGSESATDLGQLPAPGSTVRSSSCSGTEPVNSHRDVFRGCVAHLRSRHRVVGTATFRDNKKKPRASFTYNFVELEASQVPQIPVQR